MPVSPFRALLLERIVVWILDVPTLESPIHWTLDVVLKIYSGRGPASCSCTLSIYLILGSVIFNDYEVGINSQWLEYLNTLKLARALISSRGGVCNLEILKYWNPPPPPAISRYRRAIVTLFVELYPPAENHKLKFQKESLIFHFRVPRGTEYRVKRRDFVSPILSRNIDIRTRFLPSLVKLMPAERESEDISIGLYFFIEQFI